MTDRHTIRAAAESRARAMGYRADPPATAPAAEHDDDQEQQPDLPDVSPRVLYQLLTHDQLTPAQADRARAMFAWASRIARQEPTS